MTESHEAHKRMNRGGATLHGFWLQGANLEASWGGKDSMDELLHFITQWEEDQ